VPRFRSVANGAVSVVCLGLAALSVRNVYGDSAEVEGLARQQGSCPEGVCQLSRVERTPFSQTFEFRRQGATVTMRCARSAVLLGPYDCAPALR
jgi:hypothetical protein